MARRDFDQSSHDDSGRIAEKSWWGKYQVSILQILNFPDVNNVNYIVNYIFYNHHVSIYQLTCAQNSPFSASFTARMPTVGVESSDSYLGTFLYRNQHCKNGHSALLVPFLFCRNL